MKLDRFRGGRHTQKLIMLAMFLGMLSMILRAI